MVRPINDDPAVGRILFEATRPFAVEIPRRSWRHVGTTFLALAVALVTAGAAPWWPLRLCAAVVGGLVMVRAFILYHDDMHGAILRRSRLAKIVFHASGLVLLSSPRYWRHSHDFHHGNVGKPLDPEHGADLLVTSDLGSFPLMTTERWRQASLVERLRYRIARHPLTLRCACVTVFLFSLTLLPLLKHPRAYRDGALALLAHAALVAGLWITMGFPVLFFSFLLPYAIASAVGAYLFYAQHNDEGMRILRPEEWTYDRGATESSSFMRLDPVMRWFTGNTGFHHVHHLNPLIPFDRLPEAMAAVSALRTPRATSLRPREVLSCLRLNLWDPDARRLVSFREARKAA